MDGLYTADTEKWAILRYTGKRKLVIFGTGVRAKKFFAFHTAHLPIQMVIDNDKNKSGKSLGDVVETVSDAANRALIIHPMDDLQELNNDDTFVFIANATPDPLINQLAEVGIKNYITFDDWWRMQTGLPIKQKIKNNKIIFFMYMHGAHEKAITQQLLRYRSDLDVVWVVNKLRNDAPPEVRQVLATNRYDCNWEASSAKVWVTGLEILDDYYKKRDGQTYVQVKHWSSLTLKVFGPECNRRVVTEEEYHNIKKAYSDNNKKMDVVFSGSDFDEESCRRGWGYKGRVIRVGSPRSDVIFAPKYKANICQYIDVDESVNLAMYAPTFRWPFDGNKPTNDMDFELLYSCLKKRFGGEWRILLRMHPLVTDQAREISYPDFVSNVSEYHDSEELAAAADITITDFSSIMFEPAYVYKPVFLYAPDKEEYQKEHPLLLDYDNLPFPTCVTNEELAQAILNYDEMKYKMKLKYFFDSYGVQEDGHASERAAMYILGLMDAKR